MPLVKRKLSTAFQILNSALKKGGIIFRLAEHAVAERAQDPSNDSGSVAVINTGPSSFLFRKWIQAYQALVILTIKNYFEVFYRNAKHSLEMVMAHSALAFWRRSPTLTDFSARPLKTIIAIWLYKVGSAISSPTKLRSEFYLFTSGAFLPLSINALTLRHSSSFASIACRAFTITAVTTMRSEFAGLFVKRFKKFNRLDLFAFGALFFSEYSELSHAVRISITNDVVRLGRKLAASVQAVPILSQISLNCNSLMTLCGRIASPPLFTAMTQKESII